MKWKNFLIISLLMLPLSSSAQVLITLIFGDELNSGKVEFGLDGGYNGSWLIGKEDAEILHNFNLGFFFHIKLKEQSFISTGVHVKSNVGGSGMPTYSIGDPEFDAVYVNGERTTKFSIFYVPIMWQQRFNKFYIEGGIQPGLRSKVKDIFYLEDYGGDLEYTRNVSDDYTRLDFGLVGGAGYRLKSGPVANSVGVAYYYGLVDVDKSDLKLTNATLYVYMRIPIGAGGKYDKEK